MPSELRPGCAALIRALAWRTRREGLRYLGLTFVPFIFATAALLAPALITGSAVNGASTLARVAVRYGATSDAVQVGIAIVLVPGLIAVFTAVAVGLSVRNLVGSETSRGGIEALLAAPYGPGTIAAALLMYTGGMSVAYWAGMTSLSALGLVVLTVGRGSTLSLSVTYLTLAVTLPLLAGWAATGLSLLVALLHPRLTQPGQLGVLASGSLGGGVGLLPALGVLFVFVFGAPHVGPGELLLIAGGATALIAGASAWTVARRFRPDAVLET